MLYELHKLFKLIWQKKKCCDYSFFYSVWMKRSSLILCWNFPYSDIFDLQQYIFCRFTYCTINWGNLKKKHVKSGSHLLRAFGSGPLTCNKWGAFLHLHPIWISKCVIRWLYRVWQVNSHKNKAKSVVPKRFDFISQCNTDIAFPYNGSSVTIHHHIYQKGGGKAHKLRTTNVVHINLALCFS